MELGSGDKLALVIEGLDHLSIGFTVFDGQLVLVACNQRFQEMLNFPEALCTPGATLEEALRYNARKGEYGSGDVEQQVQDRLKLARQFLPHCFERNRPDGSVMEVRGYPLPQGGMVTTYTDVTQARQREQALRELTAELEQRVEARTAELREREAQLARKAALLEVVVNNVNQGISFMNANLELELCNQKFLELLDFPPNLGRPGAKFQDMARFNAERGEYGPGDVEEHIRSRIEVAKKFVGHRFERQRPNGGLTLEIMGCPTPDGGMVTTYFDITERKATERALHLERERLRNILSGTNAGGWEMNLQSGEVRVDERWAQISGHTLAEVEGLNMQSMLHFCHPDDLERTRDALRAHLRGQEEYYHCEHRIRHKDGHWVWIAAHARATVFDPDGRALWLSGVHWDITERKEAENRIRELNETLEERVAQRTAQLQQAVQSLHQSQEALAQNAAKATLSTLVASVTHELATPLGNSLITASTCSDLTRRIHDSLERGQMRRSELATFLQEMLEGSQLVERNLHRAVELMRNFKQVAADQASEQRRLFDLAAVLHEVTDTLKPSLKRYPHALVVDVPGKITMDSYPGALGQVIINLVNNAYLHAFEDGSHGTVNLTAHQDQDWVVIEVRDNGMGMTEAMQEQMFLPFFSTKIGRGGTGLGMSIVDNLVKKTLGGNLHVQSAPGEGSVFRLELPLVMTRTEDVGFNAHFQPSDR